MKTKDLGSETHAFPVSTDEELPGHFFFFCVDRKFHKVAEWVGFGLVVSVRFWYLCGFSMVITGNKNICGSQYRYEITDTPSALEYAPSIGHLLAIWGQTGGYFGQ